MKSDKITDDISKHKTTDDPNIRKINSASETNVVKSKQTKLKLNNINTNFTIIDKISTTKLKKRKISDFTEEAIKIEKKRKSINQTVSCSPQFGKWVVVDSDRWHVNLFSKYIYIKINQFYF